MGCENVVFSMSTVKKPGLPATNSVVPSVGKEELYMCLFTSDADYREVSAESQPHESTEQKHFAFRESEFPSSNSLCSHVVLIRSRNSGNRSGSMDFLEYVLPYEDISQLGCKTGGKSFWRSLRFWQRPKKKAFSCLSVASSPQHPDFKLGGQKTKFTRTRREVLGPLYSDGISMLPGERTNSQAPGPVLIAPLPNKSDGNLCPYMSLSRSQRIASGPLYLP